jgi:tetratricopeptide (TPR) repeat protein
MPDPRPLTPTWLIVEKIPFFLLSALGLALAFVVKSRFGAMQDLDQIPLADRLANAAVSYVAYLVQSIWPTKLAVFYPHPGTALPKWQAAAAAALLLATTAGLWAVRRRQPALLVGWLWYLGTLVPVIGLIQVGLQARADRYTYLPMIGIGMLVAWGGDALARRGDVWRSLVAGSGIAAVAAMAALCWVQAGYWRDSETLFRRAIAVTDNNYWAYNNLGNVYSRRQDFATATEHYREALRSRPGDAIIVRNYVEALNHQGVADVMTGDLDAAVGRFTEAIEVDPGEPKAHFNLANALAEQGKVEQARERYRAAARAAEEKYQFEFAAQIRARLRGVRD